MSCLKFSPWIAALMVMIALLQPARADFVGSLPSDLPWMMMITNDSPERTAVTVYYVGRTLEVIDVITVPANQTTSPIFPKPGKSERIIIELDPPSGGRASISI